MSKNFTRKVIRCTILYFKLITIKRFAHWIYRLLGSWKLKKLLRFPDNFNVIYFIFVTISQCKQRRWVKDMLINYSIHAPATGEARRRSTVSLTARTTELHNSYAVCRICCYAHKRLISVGERLLLTGIHGCQITIVSATTDRQTDSRVTSQNSINTLIDMTGRSLYGALCW